MAKRNLYISCGGESRRMGTDKALLEYDGASFLEGISQQALPFFHETVLLSGSNRYQIDLREIPDAVHDAGPLGGLLAALQDAPADHTHIAIIPVDVPGLSEETIRRLVYTLPDEETEAVIVRSGELIQPLAGIYAVALVPKLVNYLGRGERRVMGFLSEINHSFLDISIGEIKNINTPGDYDEL